MKKIIIAVLLVFALFTVSAQEAAEKPMGAISFILTDSFAFAGFGGELFAGPFGLGTTFTTFMFPWDDNTAVYLLQPGGYGRLYLGDLAGTFYLSAGVTYLILGAIGVGETGLADVGVVELNIGLGYHTLVGKKSNTRFCLEIGPRLVIPTFFEDEDPFFFVHFMLMFGKAF